MCDESTPLPKGELLKDGKMLKWRLKRWFWIEAEPPRLVYSGSEGGAPRGSYSLENCYCRADISGDGPDRECAVVLVLPTGVKRFYPAQEVPIEGRARAVQAWVDAITFVCSRAAAGAHMRLRLKKHIGSGFCSHVYVTSFVHCLFVTCCAGTASPGTAGAPFSPLTLVSTLRTSAPIPSAQRRCGRAKLRVRCS